MGWHNAQNHAFLTPGYLLGVATLDNGSSSDMWRVIRKHARTPSLSPPQCWDRAGALIVLQPSPFYIGKLSIVMIFISTAHQGESRPRLLRT